MTHRICRLADSNDLPTVDDHDESRLWLFMTLHSRRWKPKVRLINCTMIFLFSVDIPSFNPHRMKRTRISSMNIQKDILLPWQGCTNDGSTMRDFYSTLDQSIQHLE